VYLKDTFGNQSIYTSQDVGGAWNITEAQGSGCSTCTIRGNTQWTYDTSGDVLSAVDANNHTTSYTYDTASNMLSQSAQSDAGTVTTSYTYNSLNEVLTITDPLGP
jgi:YD repeat-containing protein